MQEVDHARLRDEAKLQLNQPSSEFVCNIMPNSRIHLCDGTVQ